MAVNDVGMHICSSTSFSSASTFEYSFAIISGYSFVSAACRVQGDRIMGVMIVRKGTSWLSYTVISGDGGVSWSDKRFGLGADSYWDVDIWYQESNYYVMEQKQFSANSKYRLNVRLWNGTGGDVMNPADTLYPLFYGGYFNGDTSKYRFLMDEGSNIFKEYEYDSVFPHTTLIRTITDFTIPTNYDANNQLYFVNPNYRICLMLDYFYLYDFINSSWTYYSANDVNIIGVNWDKDYLGADIIPFVLWEKAIWEITDKGVLKKIQALEPRDYKKVYLTNKNENLTGVVQFQNHNGNDAISAWITSNLTPRVTRISGHENVLELTATAANGSIYYPFTTDTDSIDDIWVFIPTADQFNLKYRQTTTEAFSLSFLAGNITVTDAGGTSGTVATYTYAKWIHIKCNWIKSGALNITVDNTLAHTGSVGAFDINRLYMLIATDGKYCAIDSFGQGLNSYVAGSNKKINAYVGYGSDIDEAWFSTGDADTSIMQLSQKSITEGTMKSLVVSELYKAPKHTLIRNVRPFEDEWIDLYTDAGKLYYGGKVKDNDNDGRFYFKYLMKTWEDEYKKTKITANLVGYNHGDLLKYVIDNFSKYLWHGAGTNGDVNEFTANQIDGTDSGWNNADTLTCASSLVAKKGFANGFLYDILKQLDADGGVCLVDHTVTGYTVFSGKFASSDITKQIKIEFYESATRIGYLEIAASKIRWYQGAAQDILDPAVNDTDYHWAVVFSAADDDVDVYINGTFISTETLENNITTEITKIRYTTDAATTGPTGYHSELYKGNSVVDAMHTYCSISPLLTTTYDFTPNSQSHPAIQKLIAEETGYIVSVRPSGQVYLDQYGASGITIDRDAAQGITYISKMKERNEKFSRITFYGGFVDGIQISSEGFGEPNFGDYEDWFPMITDQSRLDAMIVKALATRNITIKKQILGKRGVGMLNVGTSLTYNNSHYKISSETWNAWRRNTYNGKTDNNRVEIADSYLSPTKSDPEDSREDQVDANIGENLDNIVKNEQNIGAIEEKVGLDCAFRATQNNAQSIPNTTYTKVNWNAEVYDEGSDMTTTTFTAPVDGIYHFDAGILFTTVEWEAGETTLLLFYVEGVSHVQTLWKCEATSTELVSMNLSADIKLSATDIVEVYAYHGRGAATALHGTATYNFFNGHLVRKL